MIVKGNHGSVSLCDEVAIKEYENNDDVICYSSIEIQIISRIYKYDCFVTYNRINIDDKLVRIYMERAEINMKDWLLGSETQSLDVVTKNICLCLTHLHRLKYVHNDLRADNIVFSRGNWRIIDFSSSLRLTGKVGTLERPYQDLGLLTPEMHRNNEFTTRSDMWMLGLLCLALMKRETYPLRLKPDSNYIDECKSRLSNMFHLLPDRYRSLLEIEYRNRPTSEEFLRGYISPD